MLSGVYVGIIRCRFGFSCWIVEQIHMLQVSSCQYCPKAIVDKNIYHTVVKTRCTGLRQGEITITLVNLQKCNKFGRIRTHCAMTLRPVRVPVPEPMPTHAPVPWRPELVVIFTGADFLLGLKFKPPRTHLYQDLPFFQSSLEKMTFLCDCELFNFLFFCSPLTFTSCAVKLVSEIVKTIHHTYHVPTPTCLSACPCAWTYGGETCPGCLVSGVEVTGDTHWNLVLARGRLFFSNLLDFNGLAPFWKTWCFKYNSWTCSVLSMHVRQLPRFETPQGFFQHEAPGYS